MTKFSSNGHYWSLVLGHWSFPPLAVDRRKIPVGDEDFRAGRNIANLAGDLDLLALRGFGQALLQLSKFLAPLAAASISLVRLLMLMCGGRRSGFRGQGSDNKR